MALRWNRLHKAVRDGCTPRINALLSTRSNDIDERGPGGFTPLMIAVEEDLAHVIKILLTKGASVSVLNDGGFSALAHAAARGRFAATKLLLEAEADVEAITEEGGTPLHHAIARGNPHVAKLLIEAGANVDARQPSGQTPLYLACSAGDVESVTALLRGNADPLLATTDSSSGIRFTPLEAAAAKGHSKTVLELIQHVGIEGCGGESGGGVERALDCAAHHQHVNVMAVLMGAGVVDTGSALRTALLNGREGSVKFLLQQQTEENIGPYVNNSGIDGFEMPLLFCIMSVVPHKVLIRASRTARLLVGAGANPSAAAPATNPGGIVSSHRTPITMVAFHLAQKKFDGKAIPEEQLHALEAIRRVMLQAEAIRALSWLWPSDVPIDVHTAEGTRGVMTTSTPLTLMVPIMRRRAGRAARVVLLRALFRWAFYLSIRLCCDSRVL